MKSGNNLFIVVLAVLATGAAIAGYRHMHSRPVEPGAQPVLALMAAAKEKPVLAAPSIQWVRQPEGAEHGRLSMAFKVESSSPLRSLQIQLLPIVKLPGLSVDKDVRDVPAWLSGQKVINWDGEMDMTASPLAGTPVTIEVTATDDDKRIASSDVASVTLPERGFNQPVAKALYNLRRALREEPDKRNEALRALATVLQQRARFEGHELTLLTLRSAAVRIALDRSDEGLRSALDLLWHAAVLFEQDQVKVADKVEDVVVPPQMQGKPQ